jgi:hypothetical protein
MSVKSRERAVAEFGYAIFAHRYEQLWGELIAIGLTLQRYPKYRRADQASYYAHFRHFATRELTDDCVVRAVSSKSLSLSSLTRVAQTELGVQMINEALLEAAIDRSPAAGGTPGSISV